MFRAKNRLICLHPFPYALMQDFKHSALFSILRRIALRWFSHFERQNCANLKKHRKDRRYSFRKVLKYVELSKIYYGCVRKPPRSIFCTKHISQSPRYSRIHKLLLSHFSDRCKCTDCAKIRIQGSL